MIVNKMEKLAAETNTFPEGGEMVICNECFRAHVRDEDTYLAIAGNIYRGEGGLVGSNLDADGKIATMYVLCRLGCAHKFFEKHVLSYCVEVVGK